MSTHELKALLDRQEAALRALLPEPEQWRLVLALAATAELAERAHDDARPTVH